MPTLMHILEATAGGAWKHLRYLAAAQRAQGLDVGLILSPLRAEPGWQASAAALQDLGCRLWQVPMRRWPHPGDLRAARELRRVVAACQPDLIHLHCTKAGLLGRLALSGLGIPIVYTPHAWGFEEFSLCYLRAAGIRLERWLGRRTDRLCCISDGERDLALTHQLLPPERIVVAANGLPDDFAAALVDREMARAQLAIAKDAVAIGLFARLAPQKGHEWLFAALHQLPGALRRGLEVHLVGAGSLHDRLSAQRDELGLSAQVTFHGFLPAAERWLRALDLVVLPSRYEGLSYHLLEALAAGVPVVATDVPGNRLAGPDCPLLLVPYGDTAALAAVLGEWLSGARALPTAAQCRDYVSRHHRLAAQVARIADCYGAVLAQP